MAKKYTYLCNGLARDQLTQHAFNDFFTPCIKLVFKTVQNKEAHETSCTSTPPVVPSEGYPLQTYWQIFETFSMQNTRFTCKVAQFSTSELFSNICQMKA